MSCKDLVTYPNPWHLWKNLKRYLLYFSCLIKPPCVLQNYFPSVVKWPHTKMTKTIKNIYEKIALFYYRLQISLYISHIVAPVHKLKEVFVIWYVMNKNLFHVLKITYHSFRNWFLTKLVIVCSNWPQNMHNQESLIHFF